MWGLSFLVGELNLNPLHGKRGVLTGGPPENLQVLCVSNEIFDLIESAYF